MRQVKSGATESKIIIDVDLINQIIPQDFPNVDQEEEKQSNKNDKKQLEFLQKELQRLQEEKNQQSQLKILKLNALLVLRQIREKFTSEEQLVYETKINAVSSREEIEIIEKEFLLQIKIRSNLTKSTENQQKKGKDKL